MIETRGRLATPNGARYLKQMVSRFAHKTDVMMGEARAVMTLGGTLATLAADDTGLTVTLRLPEGGDLSQARQVIDRHLKTFAFREGFEAMDWTQGVPV
jgi:hypothetical protein